jgi:predicted permease
LAPALRLSRTNLNDTLRAEGTGATASGSHSRSREALVVAQAALSLILLVGAGLLLRSFEKLLHERPGFNENNLVVMNIGLPTSKYPDAARQVGFFNELLRRVSALSEVKSSAISSAPPLTTVRVTPMLPEGQPEVPLPERPFINVEMVSPRWFETAGVALEQGRDFADADDTKAPSVIIVNEAFAKRYWPEGNWIGKHVTVGRLKPSEVIGVSADARNNGMANAPQPQIYVPYAQISWSNMNLLVRTRVKPESVVANIKHELELLDPEQPVASIKTGEELVVGSQSQLRFTTLLMASFSAIGVTLCAVGLYSVLAYSIARRRRELAIRLAVGASQGDLFRSVVWRGVALAGIGMAIGIAVAAVSTRVITSMLYKVPTVDVETFAIAPLFLLAIAVCATSLAAERAMRINPLEALRSN